jgi:hypothetical protein
MPPRPGIPGIRQASRCRISRTTRLCIQDTSRAAGTHRRAFVFVGISGCWCRFWRWRLENWRWRLMVRGDILCLESLFLTQVFVAILNIVEKDRVRSHIAECSCSLGHTWHLDTTGNSFTAATTPLNLPYCPEMVVAEACRRWWILAFRFRRAY